MTLPFLRRKTEPMPMTLADEAEATAGLYDALKAGGRSILKSYQTRLENNVRRELDVLATIKTILAREGIEEAARIAEQKIEEALDGIELDLSSPKTKRKKVREVAAA